MTLANSNPAAALQKQENHQPLTSRYLAAWFPFLPAQRLAREQGCSQEQDKAPTVFINKQRGALRLVAISRAAMEVRLEVGLTLADACARVPGLVAVPVDHAADMALLESIADFCDRYTPLVALDMDLDTGSGTYGLVLDITGCAHLFGGQGALRDSLHDHCAKAGVEVISAIASTPDAARALARYSAGAIIEPGQETCAVAGLPVAALGLAASTVGALNRAGLSTIGALTQRPKAPLAARFGQDLVTRLARTNGEQDIAITPRRPLPPCTVERRFGEPIGREDDVLATLSHLMDEAATLLTKRGQGGRLFEANLFRTDGDVRRLHVQTSLPTRDTGPIIRLIRERIGSLADPLDPGFGYDLIRLCVHDCAPFEQVQVSLDQQKQTEEELAGLVDRLTTHYGQDAVLRFANAQTHIPERAAYTVPAKDYPDSAFSDAVDMADVNWQQSEGAPTRPIHLFAHPQRIEALAEIPDGPPLKFRWRHVLHEVARAEGPERIAPEWWRMDDASLTRDYYRVEDATGQRFWVFRDGLYGEETQRPGWFVHGLFA